MAVEPARLSRLVRVLETEVGHDIAFSVERAKIDANRGKADARIWLPMVEPGLSAPIDAASMDAALARYRGDLRDAAARTLQLAGIAPAAVGTVIFVGGSSLMTLVAAEMTALLPHAAQHRADAFTAVVDGLALATAGGFAPA
jgi:hypothetical chaperone protein